MGYGWLMGYGCLMKYERSPLEVGIEHRLEEPMELRMVEVEGPGADMFLRSTHLRSTYPRSTFVRSMVGCRVGERRDRVREGGAHARSGEVATFGALAKGQGE
jgi:hypothetical protein